MNIDFLYFVGTIVVLLVLLLANTIKILREYERGVVFTLGRFDKVKGPGLIIIIPFIQQMVRVDLRVVVMDVPTQDVISYDNVSVKVNAVVYYRVIDPEKATINVERFMDATNQLAQTTLRSVLGKHELDEMLAERDKLNEDIQVILDRQTDAWGVKVNNVEIKHVDLDESMIRRLPSRPRPSVSGAPRSSTPRANSRRRRNWSRRPRSWPKAPTPSSSDTADPGRNRRRTELHHRVPGTHRHPAVIDGRQGITPLRPGERQRKNQGQLWRMRQGAKEKPVKGL